MKHGYFVKAAIWVSNMYGCLSAQSVEQWGLCWVCIADIQLARGIERPVANIGPANCLVQKVSLQLHFLNNSSI